MTDTTTHATLRLELFVDDLPAARDFYTRVLGFRAGPAHAVPGPAATTSASISPNCSARSRKNSRASRPRTDVHWSAAVIVPNASVPIISRRAA